MRPTSRYLSKTWTMSHCLRDSRQLDSSRSGSLATPARLALFEQAEVPPKPRLSSLDVRIAMQQCIDFMY